MAIAVRALRGQSCADGVGGLIDPGAIKNYATQGRIPVRQIAKLSGTTSKLAAHGLVDYNIVDNGNGKCGGESDVQAGPAGITSISLGIVKAVDSGELLAAADEFVINKNAVAGQLLSTFEVGGQHWAWENAAVRTCWRAWRAGLTVPAYQIDCDWWQGQKDVEQAQEALSTDVPLLNTYASRFMGMYDFYAEQYGPQPPWYLIHIAELDQYCVYFNEVILPQICGSRITIDVNGNLVGGVEALNNGKPTDLIIVRHPFNAALHPTATQHQLIAKGRVAAMNLINGGDGMTTAFPLNDIPPVFMAAPAFVSKTATSVKFSAQVNDAPTLYGVAVAAGSPVPSKADIVAGTGAGNANVNIGLLKLGYLTIPALAPATQYDFHFVAVAGGVQSAIKSVFGVTTN